MDFMSAVVHEAISGARARGGTSARAAPGAARRVEQAENNASMRAQVDILSGLTLPLVFARSHWTKGGDDERELDDN